MYIAAYYMYRPKEGDTESVAELRRSLEMASQLKGTLWLLGDFNYPKFSWNHEHVPSIKYGLSFPTIYEDFITLLDNFDLVPMVSEPTRGENVLDFFLTSNHTLIDDVKISPGIADHYIVVAKVNVKTKLTKQVPRKIPLFKKTNWANFRSYMAEKKTEILSLQQQSVEEIWTAFKPTLQQGINQFVPIKNIGSKKSLPWITQEIKRLIRKRDSLFQKQNQRTIGPESAHLKPDLGVLCHHEMTLTLNTHTPLFTS